MTILIESLIAERKQRFTRADIIRKGIAVAAVIFLVKLYRDGSFVLIMAGTAVLLPASKFLIDAVYPYLVSNVAAGLDLSWQMWMYPAVFAGIAAGYFLIRTALMRRVKAMTPAEVLKERE